VFRDLEEDRHNDRQDRGTTAHIMGDKMKNKTFEAIRIRIMEEAYDLADRNDTEGYNAIKVMCSDVKLLLGDEMNENTVEDTEILKCERSELIEALQGLINLIDIKSPCLRETSGYAHAKNVLENIA